MKLIFPFAIAILAASCSLAPKVNSDSLDSEVGWLHGNCLAIKNANVSPGSQFTLMHFDSENISEKAKIKQKATDSEECYPLSYDRASVNKSAGYYFYTVKSNKPVSLAIGILKPEELSAYELKLSYCNTTEGIKFSISKSNSKIWEGYYYLGYESEPTCTSE